MMDIQVAERSDPEVMVELGRRLARLRKARGMTQAEAAARAGLDRTTVSRAERGDNPNLLTLVRLLRVYGRLGTLGSFIPEPEVSPLALIRSARGKRG
jgi:transcriptional regulator with XRE-family HTH domain